MYSCEFDAGGWHESYLIGWWKQTTGSGHHAVSYSSHKWRLWCSNSIDPITQD